MNIKGKFWKVKNLIVAIKSEINRQSVTSVGQYFCTVVEYSM